MVKRPIYFIIFLFLATVFSAQKDSALSLVFDFNDGKIKELNDRIHIKPIGVTLTEDRFGNKNSAIYMHGNASSYINLGTSALLKPKAGTISLWTNIQSLVLAGKGYVGNPILMTRSAPGDDFNIAYGIGYSHPSNRFGAQCTKDSLKEVTLFAKDTVKQNTWYHIVMTYDNNYFTLYLNGEQQEKLIKGFESVFWSEDSVTLGRSIGAKNERYSHAIFDDLRFYNRVLNNEEVIELYKEPNPNRFKNIMYSVLKYGLLILFLVVIIILLLIRNKKNLKKQKEFYELNNRVKELEIKVIKTQMNPHFISNCLAAIQNLIYSGQVDRAGEYLAKFSLFLRQVLDYSDKTYLSLEEELNIIKLNIELEQLRFKNDFSFKLDIEKDIRLNTVLVPSLISQPFIENAIWHGLLPLKEREPRLTVSVYRHNGKIYVAIEDNGVGRVTAEVLSSKKSKGTKLAADKIESINRLSNSSDYQLEIIDLFDEDKKPAGTKIIIQLSPYTLDE